MFKRKILLLGIVGAYEIIERLYENGETVAVVQHTGLQLLTYGHAVIGAEFIDFPEQAVFPGFGIMQAAAYLDREYSRALQIGLGAGTVPIFLRQQQIRTDVVEISEAVVNLAKRHFKYIDCRERDDDSCPTGQTWIRDGLEFLAAHDDNPQQYDLIIIDVYTGWNPIAFLTIEVLEKLRYTWLKQGGVVVLLFLGFINGPHARLGETLYHTCHSLFEHVHCYREEKDDTVLHPMNLIYYMSNDPFAFVRVPKTEDFMNPQPNTIFETIASFTDWEVFADSEMPHVEVVVEQSNSVSPGEMHDIKVQKPNEDFILSNDIDPLVFADTHDATQKHMKQIVLGILPSEAWLEISKPQD